MQTINQLTANFQKQTSTNKTCSDSLQKSVTDSNRQFGRCISEEQITSLFSGFKKIFGKKIKLGEYDRDMIKIWHIALRDFGMTQNEFNQAKRKSLTLEWQPTAPFDFVALARNNDEYKSAEEAFQIACSESGKMPEARKWTDSVIYETAMRCNPTVLATCLPSYIKHFTSIYRGVIEEHRAGAEFIIPKPLVAIENEHKPASKEWIDNLLANAKFGKKTA